HMTVCRDSPPPGVTEGPWAVIRRSIMHRILGLGALGLFLIAGSAPAQQPATSTGPASAPVVQSGFVTTSDAPTTRRFGIFRGRRGYNRNNYVVQPVSQARVETATTQQP